MNKHTHTNTYRKQMGNERYLFQEARILTKYTYLFGTSMVKVLHSMSMDKFNDSCTV